MAMNIEHTGDEIVFVNEVDIIMRHAIDAPIKRRVTHDYKFGIARDCEDFLHRKSVQEFTRATLDQVKNSHPYLHIGWLELETSENGLIRWTVKTDFCEAEEIMGFAEVDGERRLVSRVYVDGIDTIPKDTEYRLVYDFIP